MNNALRWTVLLCAGAAITLVSVCVGPVFLSPVKIAAVLHGGALPDEYRILLAIRLPRALMAFVIGASLSVSGTVFQAVMRNPLADPYTTGVSGGAAVGATIAVAFSLPYPFIALFSFAGSTIAIAVIYAAARARGLSSAALVLAGVALSFILSSGVLLIFALSRAEYVHRAILWLMGDISLARYESIVRMGPVALALIGIALLYCRHLDIMSFGDEFAEGLGVRRRDVMNLFWTASLLTALAVSLAGVIGFVGLIVPHTMRYLVGAGHRRLLPAAMLGGGFFLMLSDTVGRALAPPFEIPAGIITGFVGGLFFLIVLIRRGDRA